jgi:hypothetical protein
VKFGRVAIEMDEVQFMTHCGNATSSRAGGRGSTMDLTELFTFLRAYALVPQMLSKTEVVKCFRLANEDHRRSESADTLISELDFREFIDCMSRLQRISDERGHSLGDPMMDSAATMIQARVRGGLERKELNKGRKSHAAEQGSAWMLSRTPSSIKQTFSAEEVDKIKRMQVRVRNRQLKRQQEQRHALKRLTSVAPGHAKRKGKHKAIAGRVHKGAGMVGAVQRCLMQVFDSAQVCLPPSSHRDPIREKTVHLHSPRPSFSFSPRATAGLLTALRAGRVRVDRQRRQRHSHEARIPPRDAAPRRRGRPREALRLHRRRRAPSSQRRDCQKEPSPKNLLLASTDSYLPRSAESLSW